MKNWSKILLFLCLQCTVIGLSILVGWNYGIPADRQRLKDQECWLQADEYRYQWENNQHIALLQSIVELLEVKTNSTEAINMANMSIDGGIGNCNNWREFGNPLGLEWPSGEDQFNLILLIAKYRQKHPTRYAYSPFLTKETLDRIFNEAEKCRNRRASNPKWTPPPTEEVYNIGIVIEATNASYSSFTGSKQ